MSRWWAGECFIQHHFRGQFNIIQIDGLLPGMISKDFGIIQYTCYISYKQKHKTRPVSFLPVSSPCTLLTIAKLQ